MQRRRVVFGFLGTDEVAAAERVLGALAPHRGALPARGDRR